jgi:multidrug efflux pump subunit AcrA (membrane-fusion protein)
MRVLASMFLMSLLIASCGKDLETTKPKYAEITESVYASGFVRADNQYQLVPTVNGTVQSILVEEGDIVKKGQPLIVLANLTQRLNKENAQLSAAFYDQDANKQKLEEARQAVALAREKLRNDSLMFVRQQVLYKQNAVSQVEFENRQLAFENAKNAYHSAVVRYNDLKRQINFSAAQAQKSLEISEKLESDFTLRSDIDGKVYSLNKEKGELVGPQTVVAVLEMQVDEYDIVKVHKGQRVIITMDSYKSQVFEATVSKIHPLINERTKTFTVEAVFVNKPPVLYPNVSFEASIVLRQKSRALLIPRAYLNADNTVTLSNGERVKVKTGLKDYKMVEILSGISASTEIVIPE